MMEWTDTHFRYLARLLSKRTLLYTEMVTTGAILHGDRDRFLAYNTEEHPIALQLGGSNPDELARCATLAAEYGYDEINLNVGCPSDRVQNNMIGACLMAHPSLVKDCLSAMRSASTVPVTIKHRIGIDHLDSEAYLQDFVGQVAESGVTTFIVHARIAILKGLSPKENREIPPLKYEWVYRLKQHFPDLTFIINGGITEIAECQAHLKQVDGVMLGRAAYHNPYLLAEVDRDIFGEAHKDIPTRLDIANAYGCYIARRHAEGVPVWAMARHALNLFHGQKGGRAFRRHLSTHGIKRDAMPSVFAEAVAHTTRFPLTRTDRQFNDTEDGDMGAA